MMRSQHIAGLFAAMLMCGCAERSVSIAGRVTLDGKPLESGSITFIPLDGTHSADAGAVISQGGYEVRSPLGIAPGAFRVEIRSQRKTGKRILAGSPLPPGTMVDEVVEIVPEKYNTASTLRVELKAANNDVNYELTSK